MPDEALADKDEFGAGPPPSVDDRLTFEDAEKFLKLELVHIETMGDSWREEGWPCTAVALTWKGEGQPMTRLVASFFMLKPESYADFHWAHDSKRAFANAQRHVENELKSIMNEKRPAEPMNELDLDLGEKEKEEGGVS